MLLATGRPRNYGFRRRPVRFVPQHGKHKLVDSHDVLHIYDAGPWEFVGY
jgi:hypothetical protein